MKADHFLCSQEFNTLTCHVFIANIQLLQRCYVHEHTFNSTLRLRKQMLQFLKSGLLLVCKTAELKIVSLP